jgi:hypothetical protein
VQLLELVEQFYATLLLQDDQIIGAGELSDSDEDEEPLSLHVCSLLHHQFACMYTFTNNYRNHYLNSSVVTML